MCAQDTLIVLREFEMTKPNDKNDDRYKTLGFESAFDGTATGIQWSELVEGLKTNVLRQNLRVRKFVMGEYDTKSAAWKNQRTPSLSSSAASHP